MGQPVDRTNNRLQSQASADLETCGMTGKSRAKLGMLSRRKGQTWERALVRLFRSIFPDVYRARQDRRGGIASDEGADLEGTPFWVEAKHRYTINVLEALRQAEAVQSARGDSRPPVVIGKTDKPPPGWRVGLPLEAPTATMRLADWLSLVEDWTLLRKAAGLSLEVPRCNDCLRNPTSSAGSVKS